MGFLTIEIADQLSHNMTVASHCILPRSCKIRRSHIASHAAAVSETYSASVLDKEVIGYFFEHQATAPDPSEKTHPVVLLLSS